MKFKIVVYNYMGSGSAKIYEPSRYKDALARFSEYKNSLLSGECPYSPVRLTITDGKFVEETFVTLGRGENP